MKTRFSGKIEPYALWAFSFLLLISSGYGQTFTVAAAPPSLTIYPGQQNVPVTITASSATYSGPITVTLTGLPSGITVSPLTLTAGTSGTLNLSAALSAGQEGLAVGASWTAPVTVVGAAGAAQASAPLFLTISISNSSFAPAPAAINLPIVNINTNGVPVIDKTTEVPGSITITSADGKTSYLPNSGDADTTATFHVHGTTTALMPKLPYHVKLNTSLDVLGTMGLACPYVTSKGKAICDKSKTYILLANYDDKTLLRDWAASALANAIPIGNGYLNSPPNSPTPSGTSALMPWAPHSLFVELYLNGVYEGNYQLIEWVKVDSHRVNINELSETDISPTAVTGGYLMEIDEHQDEAYVFNTPHGLPIGLIDPDFTPDPEVPAQTSYISNYVDAAETALYSDNFTDPVQGWRAYFDEASAVNFYIVNDLMGNLDGGDFFSSVYLYKDKNNPLIYMGPVWDFDISSGNVNYEAIVNPTVPWMQTTAWLLPDGNWYEQWFKDPGFKADVATQWNTLMKNGVFTSWLASIQQQSAVLAQSQANNFARWPMLGIEVWPNPEAAGSYQGEVQYLTNWLKLRIGYLDSLFSNKAQTGTALGVVAGALRSGSPVTLAAQVTGGTAPTGVVSFLSGGVLLGAATLDGSGAASLTTSNLPPGTNNLQAVYGGDASNALSASTIQTVTVAAALAGTVVSIAGPFLTAGQGTLASFTASVIGNSGSAVPSGAVTFSADGGPGTTVMLDGTGQASYSAGSLAAGPHTIMASYPGDANYSASSGLLAVTLNSTQPIGPIAPGDGATNVSQTPVLSWTASSGADSYDVYFGAAASPTLVASTTGTSYAPGLLRPGTTYYWQIVAWSGAGAARSAVWSFSVGAPAGLQFVPVAPCRIADTRGLPGPFGSPSMAADSSRSFAIPQGGCGIPSTAQAYSLNVTVVPQGPLYYLTLWPTGQAQPAVSTLNSWDGSTVANASVVPAGTDGAVSVYVPNATDLILDINGYFDSATGIVSYSFYPFQPCRVADTRIGSGPLGGPPLDGGESRDFPVASGPCGLPSTAGAYSLNVTVVPAGYLGYLTTWATGHTPPDVSTLNSWNGQVVANAAIVAAGSDGSISVFVPDPTDLVLDVSGYFGPPGSPGALSFYPVTPCRVADTRGPAGPFGGPELEAGETRSFAIPAGNCNIPPTAAGYSLNVTAEPDGPLSYLTVWPSGSDQPVASTLNSWDGAVVANAAVLAAGAGGGINVYVTDPTHVILDVNGYFAP